eukprot:2708667-Ditylum_brightwellii.AAC.1
MEIVNMVAEGTQQVLTSKDQDTPKENTVNMIQDEENSVQQQLTEIQDLVQTMQQQQNAPTTPLPYPHYQPAA